MHPDRGLVDHDIRPGPGDQLILVDQFAWALNQCEQNAERAAADANRPVVLHQHSPRQQQAKATEGQNLFAGTWRFLLAVQHVTTREPSRPTSLPMNWHWRGGQFSSATFMSKTRQDCCSCNPGAAPLAVASDRELIQKCLGGDQIGGPEALGEPAIDRGQQVVRIADPALVLP